MNLKEIPREYFIGAAVLALILLAIFLVYPFISPGERPISEERFKLLVVETQDFSIFMNATGTDNIERQKLFQCGADLAYSLALLGKNVTNYVVVGNECLATEKNTTVEECVSEAGGTYAFFLHSGSDPLVYWASHAVIFVPKNYTGECRIASRVG